MGWGGALHGDTGALRHSGLGIKEILGLAPRKLWGWAVHTLGVGTPRRLWAWALREHSALRTPAKAVGLGKPGRLWRLLGTLWGWALQGDSGSGAGTLWGWALQGRARSRPGEEKSSGRGEELSLKSNNPTPRVGKKGFRVQGLGFRV